jgi:hypothetical protein
MANPILAYGAQQVAGHAVKRAPKLLAAGVGALLLLVMVPVLVVLHVNYEQQQEGIGSGAGLPAAAQPFLAIYEDAAKVYGVNPFLLMAVHEDETNYGTSELPGVNSAVNTAGCCAGPMQFLITGGASPAQGGSGGTWAGYARAYEQAKLDRPDSYPGRQEQHPNVYDNYDAIYAAAKYFAGLGAGPNLDGRTYQALLAYKGTPPASIPFAQHDYERAKDLEELALTSQGDGGGALPDVPGSRGRVDAATGEAHAPEDAPAAVKRMIAAGNRINHLPYVYGGGHPNYLTDQGLDCSSSTSYVLHAGGVFASTSAWVSGNFMSWGEPGPGRWVTVYAHGGHVWLIIAGIRFDTSHYGATMPAGTGPRWSQNLNRPTAGFAVRHPPGL